jgi:hypothetical protein
MLLMLISIIMLILGLVMVIFDALIHHIPYHVEVIVIVVAVILGAYSLIEYDNK